MHLQTHLQLWVPRGSCNPGAAYDYTPAHSAHNRVKFPYIALISCMLNLHVADNG